MNCLLKMVIVVVSLSFSSILALAVSPGDIYDYIDSSITPLEPNFGTLSVLTEEVKIDSIWTRPADTSCFFTRTIVAIFRDTAGHVVLTNDTVQKQNGYF
jgi:hypothetical protein